MPQTSRYTAKRMSTDPARVSCGTLRFSWCKCRRRYCCASGQPREAPLPPTNYNQDRQMLPGSYDQIRCRADLSLGFLPLTSDIIRGLDAGLLRIREHHYFDAVSD